MGIKTKNRDPKTTDFSNNDIVINHKEGTLFYKSDTGLIKLGPSTSGSGGGGTLTFLSTGQRSGSSGITGSLDITGPSNTMLSAVNISSSNFLYAKDLVVAQSSIFGNDITLTEGNVQWLNSGNDQTIMENSAGGVTFGQSDYPITFNSDNVDFIGHITASEISASGTIYAEKIITQEITASYVTSSTSVLVNNYTSSGNSIFGNDAADTHTFTGNITASGNISASGDVNANSFSSDGNYAAIWNGSTMVFGTYQQPASIRSSELTLNQGNLTLTHATNGHITASGNISSSNNIYASDYFDNGVNINTLYDLTPEGTISGSAQLPSGIISGSTQLPVFAFPVGSFKCNFNSTNFANEYFGPGQNQYPGGTWTTNYGDITGVATMLQEFAVRGLIVPFDCTLIGFQCLHNNYYEANNTVTLHIFTASADHAGWSATSHVDIPIVDIMSKTTVANNTVGNTQQLVKTDGDVDVNANDVLYIRLKKTGGVKSNYHYFSDLRLFLKHR